MDHDNTGGAVSGGCIDRGHNHCNFDLSLSHNFEERYKFADCIINHTHDMYVMIILAYLYITTLLKQGCKITP